MLSSVPLRMVHEDAVLTYFDVAHVVSLREPRARTGVRSDAKTIPRTIRNRISQTNNRPPNTPQQ